MMCTTSKPGDFPKTVFDSIRRGVVAYRSQFFKHPALRKPDVGNRGLPVYTFMMGALLGGCASIPREPSFDAVAELVEPSRCTEICWVMSARNDNYFEARVYISGQRVATLPGMMAK